MSDRELLLSAAIQQYNYCEDAKGALRTVGKKYKHKKFGEKIDFLAMVDKVDQSAPDDASLRRLLSAVLRELFDEIVTIWISVTKQKVQQCQAWFKTYSQKVDGKQQYLATIATAPASPEYKDRIEKLTLVLDAQKATPPVLADPITDDWSFLLSAIKNVNAEVPKLSKEMADWIASAEKESREKTSHQRAWIALAVSFCGGGGLIGIVIAHWAAIKSFLRI